MTDAQLDASDDGTKDMAVLADELMDAIAGASDQDKVTWIMDGGKRIAAIVPPERVANICLRHLQPVFQSGGYHADGSRCR